jgi:hypothetical protein
MGTFRSGLILAGLLTFSAMAQDAVPVNPQPQPADPNAPGLPVPLPATPEIDPSIPAQIPVQPEAGVTNAPTDQVPKAAPKPKKKAAQKIPTLRGTVGSVNTTNMTLIVLVKEKEEPVKITSNTRVFADAKPAILSDGKQGEKVLVEYKSAKDKSKEATAIRFGSLTAKKE